jgi:predicted enzyme related to lactoylglutathione lyase
MTIRTEPWPAGVPCWADIQVPDVPSAQALYAAVLGWAYTEANQEFGGYVIGQVDGVPTAGIGPQMGGPAAWTLYLATDDADATAARIGEHGGTVVLAPGDVGAAGRLAIAVDPTGAVFGLWQGGEHIGSGLVNAPGGITWEDLRSPGPAAARAFYTGVFGYEYAAVPGAPDDYMTFALPGDAGPRGGIGPAMGGDPAPAWLTYFAVADAAAAAAAATTAGGALQVPDFQTPFGQMARITDPNGAVFWVVQTAGAA